MNNNKFEKLQKKELMHECFELEDTIKLEKIFGEMKELVTNNGGPEEFFSCKIYEFLNKFENLLNELSDLALQAIKAGEFTQALNIAKVALEISGVEAAENTSVESPNGAIALSEAVNWAAKTISYGFYALKPKIIIAASLVRGVDFGYKDDGTYYLGSPTIGTASFHDPYDEVGYIMTHCLNKVIPEWKSDWSGISRQEDAFKILEDISSNQSLIKVYADLTSPEEVKATRDKYMKNNFHDRLITLGSILNHKNKN